MGYNSETNTITRDYRFETADDAENGDQITQQQMDVALDEIVEDVNLMARDFFDDIDAFNSVFLGASSTNPTVDGDGNPIQAGALYVNTFVPELRFYNGYSWTPAAQSQIVIDNFTGDGARTSFALGANPQSEKNIFVHIDGVYQNKDAFSVSGSDLVFSEAPPDGAAIEALLISITSIGQTSADLVSNSKGGTVQDFINKNKFFDTRNATNAAAGVALGDGEVWWMAGLPYINQTGGTACDDLGVSDVAAFGFFASPKHYGGVGDGSADDTDAIQKAVDYCICQIPSGTWRVTSSISYGSNTKIVGAGQSRTVILSDVIGDSLFKPDGEVVFAYIGDMELRGNGLTGASGNGHAVNMIDPTSGSAFSPQQCVLERLEIRNFRGQDIRKTGVATTICAAGVAGNDCLQNTFQNVLVDNCGHGFYMETTQNCRALECVAIGCDKMGLFVYDSENFVSYGCVWLGCGDGTEDPGYPTISGAFGSCVVLDAYNHNFVLRDSKIKNIYAGTSLFRSIYSDNSVYDANWIRPDAITNVTHKGFYIEYSVGIRIINNTFHPSNSGHAQDYEMIEIYTTQNAVTSFTIEGNTFGDVAGQNISYNIKLNGNSVNRALQGRIVGNQFGFYGARAVACVVTSDILLSNCSLTDSQIAFNNFYAAANVTRTACIAGSSFTDERNVIGPNKFTAFGGAITAEMSGVRKDHYYESKFHNPPSLADGDRDSTNVTVTGAAIGDTCEVAISTTTSGVHVYGFVSASDTVTVIFQNETGGTVDVGSVAVYVTVRKNKAPAL